MLPSRNEDESLDSCGGLVELRGSRSDRGRGERKFGQQERNLKSHCSGGAEAERSEELRSPIADRRWTPWT